MLREGGDDRGEPNDEGVGKLVWMYQKKLLHRQAECVRGGVNGGVNVDVRGCTTWHIRSFRASALEGDHLAVAAVQEGGR